MGTARVPGKEELTGHLDGLGAFSPYRTVTLFLFFHSGSGVGFTFRQRVGREERERYM